MASWLDRMDDSIDSNTKCARCGERYGDHYGMRCDPDADQAFASSGAPLADGWQPIATAPEDGQCLLWVKTDDGGEVMKLYRDKKGNWLYEGEPTYCTGFYIEPTHWMPLPHPPTSPTSEESGNG